jgi:hypothetical protein
VGRRDGTGTRDRSPTLTELEACAARTGAHTVRLETNRALTEAIALYRSAGYAEVAPFNDDSFADHWFEKSLG